MTSAFNPIAFVVSQWMAVHKCTHYSLSSLHVTQFSINYVHWTDGFLHFKRYQLQIANSFCFTWWQTTYVVDLSGHAYAYRMTAQIPLAAFTWIDRNRHFRCDNSILVYKIHFPQAHLLTNYRLSFIAFIHSKYLELFVIIKHVYGIFDALKLLFLSALQLRWKPFFLLVYSLGFHHWIIN